MKRLSLLESHHCQHFISDTDKTLKVMDFFGSDGSYILFNCGIELANTLINPQSYYCMPNGALHLLRLHQCSARYSATAITCVKTPKYCCSLLFISPRTFNSSVCFGQYGLSSELVS